MPENPISMPAGYAPAFAIGYSDAGALAMVDSARPLPVISQPAPVTAPPALQGIASGTSQVGPFNPVALRPVMITLSGTWQGRVKVLRSVDGGTTRLPLTLGGVAWADFTTTACEPIWTEEEAGASLYIDIALTSGSLSYRLAQ